MRKMTMTALILGGCLLAASPGALAAGGGAAGTGAGRAGTGTGGMGVGGTGVGRTGIGMPATNAPDGSMNQTVQPGMRGNGNCRSSATPGKC
jgi:hypothetical protein